MIKKMSAEAVEQLTKRFEKLSLVAYPDPGSGGDPYTIGYGHTKGVVPGQIISIKDARQFLMEDLVEAEKAVNVFPYLNQSQFDAVTDFVFNIGESKFKASTMYKMLSAGNTVGASSQFNRWVFASGKKLGGLVKRRDAETKWFNRES